jgi:hypothetical protein
LICEETPWKAEQQTQLERALRATQGVRGAARWTKVAAAVDGKSEGQCKRRVKALRQMLMQQRSSS